MAWALPSEAAMLLREGFDGFDQGFRPAGWEFERCDWDEDVFTSTGYFGQAAPSLSLALDNARATSSQFPADPSNLLRFWVKGVSTDSTSALKVEEFAGSWKEVTTIAELPVPGRYLGPFRLASETERIRFTYEKSYGAVALDDVQVHSARVNPGTYMRVYYLSWTHLHQSGQYGQIIYAELPGPDGILGTADDVRILYDGGASTNTNSALANFLDQRIGHEGTIHHMVLSHPHTDHFQGLRMVVNRYNVLNYYESFDARDRNNVPASYTTFRNLVSSKGIPIHFFGPGDYLSGPLTNVGPGWDPRIEARVLAARETGSDPNAWSGVIQVRNRDSAYLWGGDATFATEGDILNDSVFSEELSRTDIYAVHHHGSRNSSGQTFLDQMAPQYAIVPVAFRSVRSHPHRYALNRIDNTGAIVYRNDIDFHVEVASDDLGNYEITRWNLWNPDSGYETSGELAFPPPPVVGNLTVRKSAPEYVVVGWDPTGQPGDRYLVYRSNHSDGDGGAGRTFQPGLNRRTGIYERLTPSPISFTTFTDYYALPDRDYHYRVATVRTYSVGGESTTQERRWSNEAVRRAPSRWFLPAGATRINGIAFDTYVLIFNPNDDTARTKIQFVDADGPIKSIIRDIPGRSRHTVKLNDHIGNSEAVSTIVTSLDGVPIICERAMYWNAGGRPWGGGHNTVGIGKPSREWYFAEGATHIFDQFIHVLNPDQEQTAVVKVEFSNQNGERWTAERELAPRSNWTVDAKEVAGSRDQIATRVWSENGVPIAADRTMYWDAGGVRWADGHASVGVSAPASRWQLAEGATHIFDQYVVVYNPSDNRPANIELNFMNANGEVIERTARINAGARYTAHVNKVAGRFDQVATEVTSDIPVVAERAMYWEAAGAAWGGGHCTVGAPLPAKEWYLPEGATHLFDEYLIVSNPSKTNFAQLILRFMDGNGNPSTFRPRVGPRTRFTTRVNDLIGAVEQVSAKVESDIPVVVERAMYWDRDEIRWISGHVTIGVPRIE